MELCLNVAMRVAHRELMIMRGGDHTSVLYGYERGREREKGNYKFIKEIMSEKGRGDDILMTWRDGAHTRT